MKDFNDFKSSISDGEMQEIIRSTLDQNIDGFPPETKITDPLFIGKFVIGSSIAISFKLLEKYHAWLNEN